MRSTLSLFGALSLSALTVVAQGQEVDHARLNEISRQQSYLAATGRTKAHLWAKLRNHPIEVTDGNRTYALMSIGPGGPLYYTTDNATSASSISTDDVWSGGSLGLSLDGAGISLGIWDGGVPLTSHDELVSRVTIAASQSMPVNFHATHTAGTFIGSGADPAAKGMAHDADLTAWDWTDDAAEMAAAAGGGLEISNHSYGAIRGWASGDFGAGSGLYWFGDIDVSLDEDLNFGRYDATAEAWDAIANAAPTYLIFKSAGNDRDDGPASQPVAHFVWDSGTMSWVTTSDIHGLDGDYDSISHAGAAKNVMTVGAVEDVPFGYSGSGSVIMTDFSGWGPMDDGRVKPDIVANGAGLYSALIGSDSDYGELSGTSMASPSAAGSAALLIQHWSAKLPGVPLSATLKCVIIHTANECSPAPGPDYSFGWGLMNTGAAAGLISDAETTPKLIQEKTLADSGMDTYTITTDGSGPIRATMVWNDPAGIPASYSVDDPSPMLINDLELEIEYPDTTVELPWVLDPSSPATPATKGKNSVDNVEQVDIETPPAGTYKVKVSHTGSLTGGSQDYSLVITGGTFVEDPALASVTFAPTKVYNSTDTTMATVALDGPAPAGGITVSLKGSSSLISVPATVTIPEGDTDADVVVTVDAPTATHPWGVRIIASYDGVTEEDYLAIHPIRLMGVSVSPGTVAFGAGATFTVMLDGPAPPEGVDVTAFSTRPGFVDLASTTITVPAGSTSASTAVTTTSFFRIYFVWLRASLNGYGRSARLNVGPW